MKFNTKALAQLTLSLTLLAGIVVVSTTTTFAQEKEEKTSTKHAKKAKISIAAARTTALQKAPGTVDG